MRLKLRARNHPSLRGIFSGMPDAVDRPTSIDLESECPQRLRNDIIGGRHERREFSVAGLIFTNVQKYFSGPLTGGGGSPPVDRLLVRYWRHSGEPAINDTHILYSRRFFDRDGLTFDSISIRPIYKRLVSFSVHDKANTVGIGVINFSVKLRSTSVRYEIGLSTTPGI